MSNDTLHPSALAAALECVVLAGKSLTMETQPRPLSLRNKSTIYYAYVEGPSGARIELVQR